MVVILKNNMKTETMLKFGLKQQVLFISDDAVSNEGYFTKND